jgi:hypothetical protein
MSHIGDDDIITQMQSDYITNQVNRSVAGSTLDESDTVLPDDSASQVHAALSQKTPPVQSDPGRREVAYL